MIGQYRSRSYRRIRLRWPAGRACRAIPPSASPWLWAAHTGAWSVAASNAITARRPTSAVVLPRNLVDDPVVASGGCAIMASYGLIHGVISGRGGQGLAESKKQSPAASALRRLTPVRYGLTQWSSPGC